MNKHLDESDAQLFRESVGDAEPLSHDRAEAYRRKPAPVPIDQPAYLREQDEQALLSESEVETHEFLSYARAGLQNRVFSDLQRGHIPIELEVDLHGLTAAFARDVFDDFLAECTRRRVRCARIIHGKGYGSQARQPVLKSKVNYWLRLREDVLAFCSATRRDGGTGAVYVLLRNPDKARGKHRRGKR